MTSRGRHYCSHLSSKSHVAAGWPQRLTQQSSSLLDHTPGGPRRQSCILPSHAGSDGVRTPWAGQDVTDVCTLSSSAWLPACPPVDSLLRVVFVATAKYCTARDCLAAIRINRALVGPVLNEAVPMRRRNASCSVQPTSLVMPMYRNRFRLLCCSSRRTSTILVHLGILGFGYVNARVGDKLD